MKFNCSAESLLKEASYALDFAAQKNFVSVLSHFYIEVSGNILKIQATNQKMAFTTTIAVHSQEDGSCLVPAEKLMNSLKAIDPATELIISDDGDRLLITNESQKIKFFLKIDSTEKLPIETEFDETESIEISQKLFLDMLNQVYSSISTEETKYAMNGANFEGEDDLIMVGTNGKKLSMYKVKNDGPSFKAVTIPISFLNIIRKMGTGEGNFRIRFSANGNLVIFNFATYEIYSVLISQAFPNYRVVIPKDLPYTCRIKTADMNEALKRISVFIDPSLKRVLFRMIEDSIEVYSDETDQGKANEIIDCEVQGEPMEFSLTLSHVQPILKTLDSEYFVIHYENNRKQLIITTDPKSDYFHLLMPLNL